MPVTQSYKTVTFSRSAGFAVVRALRQRLEQLVIRQNAFAGQSDAAAAERQTYYREQIEAVHAALGTLENAAYEETLV